MSLDRPPDHLHKNRLADKFSELEQFNRKALNIFIMAYDPSPEATLAIMHEIANNGADIIELGVAFSDPMADGPTIAAAGERALEQGANISGVLNIVRKFRQSNQHTPIILMGYYNPFYHYGIDKFAIDAMEAGIDGVIIVDLPPDEDVATQQTLQSHNIDIIRLIAPTDNAERIKLICDNASGFLYYIMVKGITGGSTADMSEVAGKIAEIRDYMRLSGKLSGKSSGQLSGGSSGKSLPILGGFGVKTAAQVAEVAKICDGVVVGSSVVSHIDANRELPVAELAARVGEFVAGLKI